MARVVRVPIEGLRSGEQRLDRKTSHYLAHVLRLEVGASFVAFDVAARSEAPAELVSFAGNVAVCRFQAPRALPPAAQAGPILIQALSKGDKIEQVIRGATALGAAEVWVVETERSQLRMSAEASLPPRWQAVALDAARQSGRADVPKLARPMSFARALADAKHVGGIQLCLAPTATLHLRDALSGSAEGPVALLIGPEGGLSPSEIALAVEHGFVAVRFGELVLRAEIAGIAVLGALIALGPPSPLD